jgi:alpha,alpha-trehalose phosphorylase
MNNLHTWALRREGFDPAQQVLDASLFALGNGFIGLRGVIDEGPVAGEHDGCYLNGFYDTAAIHHPETAYGLAGTNQFMLSVPNGRRLEIWLDDERLDLRQGKVHSCEQVIDFRDGVLRRRLEWEAPSGRVLRVTSERLACLQRQTVWAARTRVEPLNFDGTISLVMSLDAQIAPLAAGNDPRIGSHVKEAPLVLDSCNHGDSALRQRHHTRHSGLHMVSMLAWEAAAPAGKDAIVHAPEPPHDATLQNCLRHRVSVALGAEQVFELVRFGTYQTSVDLAEADLETLADDTIAAVREAGFDALLREQAQYLQEFWDRDDQLQQGLRFNAWHLLQSAGRDGRTNIPAKGLTGEGYEGHTFWDTEVYVLPFFAATRPEIARALLEYRYRHLGSARARALDLAVGRGAVYPWRTIAGVECSAYFLAGTAQAHLNADIAHAVQL